MKPGLHLTCVRVPELGDDTIRKVDRLIIHAHQHAPSNYIAGYGEEGIAAHDAIDIIKKGPAHAHEMNVEHPFWLSAPALKDLRHRQGPRPSQRAGVDLLSEQHRHRSAVRCRRRRGL